MLLMGRASLPAAKLFNLFIKAGRRMGERGGSLTLPTTTLVQKGCMAVDRPGVTRPPGGQYAQHLTGTLGNLHASVNQRPSAKQSWVLVWSIELLGLQQKNSKLPICSTSM